MGIDGITQLLAFALFLVGFAGIALVVVNATRGQAARGGIVLAAVGIIGGIIFLFVSEGILQVGPTERAVVFNNITGTLSEEPLEPGIHVIVPVVNEAFVYRVSRQEYTMSSTSGEGVRANDDAIEARSIDGQEVFVDVTLIFTIAPDDVEDVHRNWSDVDQGYIEGLIRPQTRSIVRDVVASVEAEQIFGAERTEVQASIQNRLTEALDDEGFTVIDVLLRSINFSESFINAIEDRQVEELRRDRAEIEALRVQTEAEGRANATIEEARGSAEAQRINAEAEADVIRLRAAAEADALRLVSEQIAANPNLLQYEYIQNLTDNIEVSIIPSNTPFLFDASTFQDVGGDDFEAPTVPQLPSSSNSDTNDNSGNSDN